MHWSEMFSKVRSSLTTRMTLLILLGSAAVLAFILIYNYTSSRAIILEDAEENARHLTLSYASKIEQVFRSVAKVPENLAVFLETNPCDTDTLMKLVQRTVETNKEIYGATVSFEPYAFDKRLPRLAPYYYRKGAEIAYEDLGTESYNYFVRDWYYIPKVLKAPIWSQPYFDEGGGGTLMTTYSFPLFDNRDNPAARTFKGILTADIALEWLTKLVGSIQVEKNGFCFIVSDAGTFVAHPQRELIMWESMFSLAEERGAETLRRVGRAMIRDEAGFVDIGTTMTGEEAFLAFARIPSPGWSLGAVFPKKDLLAEVAELHRTVAALAVVGVALMLAVSFIVARSITRPLRSMAKATRKVAEGDLDVDVEDTRRQDEVGQLSRAFVRMTQDLKKYIKDLTEAKAARQRIESELSIAADIQRSMLPSTFPPFPEHDEFDIHAVMRPAREVGGDFYDFFLLDEHRLCVVVGDVSGKGVPAALLMTVTKYLVEVCAGEGAAPDEVLRRVNNQLARNNDACMFVTVFIGVLDWHSGEFIFTSGGHNPPLLLKPSGEVTYLRAPGGPAAGLIPDAEFQTQRLELSSGFMLLAYSDGVTEAFNVHDEAFSEERLRDTIRGVAGNPARDVVQRVLDEIDSFCTGAPQTDDITIVALRFTPSKK